MRLFRPLCGCCDYVCQDFSPVWVRGEKQTSDKPQEAEKYPDPLCC